VRNPELYRTALAQAQEGIAQALVDADNLEEAEQHYIDAMTNWSIMLDINPNDNDFRAGLAQVQHKLRNLYLELYQDNAFGILFNEDKDTTSTNVKRILSIKTNAESLFSKVFENYNAIISNNSSQYRLALAKAQGDLGRFYMSFMTMSSLKTFLLL
jgi:tetratricopeptide (TPR) repeat protein